MFLMMIVPHSFHVGLAGTCMCLGHTTCIYIYGISLYHLPLLHVHVIAPQYVLCVHVTIASLIQGSVLQDVGGNRARGIPT